MKTEFRQLDTTFVFPYPDYAFDNSGLYNITINIGDSSVYVVNDTYNFSLASSPHRLEYIITDCEQLWVQIPPEVPLSMSKSVRSHQN